MKMWRYGLLLALAIVLGNCQAEQPMLKPITTRIIANSEHYPNVLRLDRAERPHLVFAVSHDQPALHYRQPDGNDEIIVSFVGNKTEFDFAFLLDHLDQPVVAYQHEGLWLARRTTAGWVHEIIDSGLQRGYLPAMAISHEGQVHVSYFDLASNDLRYATNANNRWQVQIVDASGRPGFHLAAGFSQLTLDCDVAPFCSAQRPVIIYLAYRYKPYDGELRAATPGHDGWQIETIDHVRGTGGFPSLRVTHDGEPWVSYYRASTWDFAYGELRVAHRKRFGWQIDTIDSGIYVGRYQALAMTNKDLPVVLYTGKEAEATLAVLCGDWQRRPVLVSSAMGWLTLSIDSTNQAWITLTSVSAQTLLLELDISGKVDTCV